MEYDFHTMFNQPKHCTLKTSMLKSMIGSARNFPILDPSVIFMDFPQLGVSQKIHNCVFLNKNYKNLDTVNPNNWPFRPKQRNNSPVTKHLGDPQRGGETGTWDSLVVDLPTHQYITWW